MKRKKRTQTGSKSLRNNPSQIDLPPTTLRRKFWTMGVPAGERILLGRLSSCLMVVKNHGPGKIVVDLDYPREGFEILPGYVRALTCEGPVHLKGPDAGIALAEFRLMPLK
jgi:hypothetical protein